MVRAKGKWGDSWVLLPPCGDSRTIRIAGLLAKAHAPYIARQWPDRAVDLLQKAAAAVREDPVEAQRYRQEHAIAAQFFELDAYADVVDAEFLDLKQRLLPSAYRPPRKGGSISLDSDPEVVFVMTMLPWLEIDFSGLDAEPINLPNPLRLAG